MALSEEAMAAVAGLGIDMSKSVGQSLTSHDSTPTPDILGTPEAPIEINAEPEPIEEGSTMVEEVETPVEEETSTEEVEAPAEDESPEEVSDEAPEDIEWIKAGGKKVKVDYTDRARTKKAHELAAGFREMTASRDTIQKEFDSYKEEVASKIEVLDILNQHKDDPAELVRLFTGGKVDLEEWRQAQNAHEEKLSLMSDDELAAYQRQINDRVKDERIAALEAKIERSQADQEAATTSAREIERRHTLENAFNKYRMAGKLGDPMMEEALDNGLWPQFKAAMDKRRKGKRYI
jgi:hypothetical protein